MEVNRARWGIFGILWGSLGLNEDLSMVFQGFRGSLGAIALLVLLDKNYNVVLFDIFFNIYSLDRQLVVKKFEFLVLHCYKQLVPPWCHPF